MALTDLTMQDAGSHNYSYTKDSADAKFNFTCAFSDRFINRDALLNSMYSDLSFTQSSYISDTESENLICTAVSIKALGKESGNPKLALIGTTFTSPSFSVSASSDDIDQKFGIVSNWQLNGDFAGENLRLNAVNWQWHSDATHDIKITPEEGINGVKYLPHLNLVYRGEWNSIDISSINNCIGYINSDVFVGAPAQTLMLTGCSFEQSSAPSGAKWLITYNFGYKANTWNKFWNQKKNKYFIIEKEKTHAGSHTPASSDTVFSDVNFARLNPDTW